MDPKKIGRESRERKIQNEIKAFLRIREWTVMETHGNMYQCGFPDLYACCREHGQRWIEVKVEDNYEFTPAQLKYFPLIQASGIGIWIMVAATREEYLKLFKEPNWYMYLYRKL